MLKRLACRIFGHRPHYTHVKRARVVSVVVGCTRCDRVLEVNPATHLPRMTVPKG